MKHDDRCRRQPTGEARMRRRLRSAAPLARITAGWLLALTAGLSLPAFAEEGFFRGLMQGWLREAWGRWPAVVATSAAFGLIHGDRVQGSVAFITGLWLGWITERFGGIRPAIFAHGTLPWAIFCTISPRCRWISRGAFSTSGQTRMGASPISTMVSPGDGSGCPSTR